MRPRLYLPVTALLTFPSGAPIFTQAIAFRRLAALW
jgi:hypothetical protein